MRKFLIISIILAALVFSSCGNSKDNQKTDLPTQMPSSTVSDTESESSASATESEWGVSESIVAENEKGLVRAHIKFPTLSGVNLGTGKIAYQTDKTLVILDAQIMNDSPKVNDEFVLPAYFEQIKEIIDQYRRANYSDFDFSISEQQTIKVNDYDMVKYIGTHTCKCDGKPLELKFAAYSTKLKANDAYIYWMVLDESEDQSLSQTILEYADKMADSLHE